MTFDRTHDAQRPDAGSGGRSLKTATEALRALRLLGASSGSVTSEELAAELGKSKETARYLLNTLCLEGFAYREGARGTYRLAATPPWASMWGTASGARQTELPEMLADVVNELYRRTNQRSYLARLEDDTTSVLDVRGCQGLPRIPGLAPRVLREQVHALAVSKSLIAMSPEVEKSLLEDGALKQFTEQTITDSEDFMQELAQVRREGYALDREEFAEGFCCIAAPVFNPAGEVAASLGISVLANRFHHDHAALINDVVDVAARASERWHTMVTAAAQADSDPIESSTGGSAYSGK